MNQHPLPQNITSYQFHLIGSMTLKQFLFLGGGVVIAWLFWSYIDTPIFKWPLSIFTAASGVAFAFLPYQDRSLDLWLTAFIKTIYNPTQFLWKKHPSPPDFLSKDRKKTLPQLPVIAESTPTPKSLTQYLESLPQPGPESQIDTRNQASLHQITQLFSDVKTPVPPNPKLNPNPLPPTPSLKVKVRKLKTPIPTFSNTTFTPPQLSPLPETQPTPKPLPPPSSPESTPHLTRALSSSERVSQRAEVPPQPLAGATLNPHLPFPQTPTTPNLIVGMTLDQNRHILDGTIVEILDSLNHPVRALKSNKLGQFYTATPLPNDTYRIQAEKENYSFTPISLTLQGNIIQPLEIAASSSIQPSN
ncbi:MAG: PrgI family protein [Candidatus Chisholmbacteria bacterium]|nr:PrgI family protein [Candidatus Chisholmbacteria bacterium]